MHQKLGLHSPSHTDPQGGRLVPERVLDYALVLGSGPASHWLADPEFIPFLFLVPSFMFFFLEVLSKFPPQLCYSGQHPRMLSELTWAVDPATSHIGGCLNYKVKLIKIGNKVLDNCDITVRGGVVHI